MQAHVRASQVPSLCLHVWQRGKVSLEDMRRRDSVTLDVFSKKSKRKRSSFKFTPDNSNERKVEVIDWPVFHIACFAVKKSKSESEQENQLQVHARPISSTSQHAHQSTAPFSLIRPLATEIESFHAKKVHFR